MFSENGIFSENAAPAAKRLSRTGQNMREALHNSRKLAEIRKKLAAGEDMSSAISEIPLVFTSELADVSETVQEDLQGAGSTITPLLNDPATTDVLVNGPNRVWVDRGNGLEPVKISDPRLESEAGVRALAVRLAAGCGQRLDDAAPIADGTFSSGMRLHAVLPPLCAEGTLISLRTQRRRKLSFSDLVRLGAIHPELAEVIEKMVEKRANVLISGATGSGKTTVLAALLGLVPHTERILVIEESAELYPSHPHTVHLQSRNPNVQGKGEITMSDLVRAAMRMRPDRIILGECRGPEVRDVLGALNTGHEGGWATIHANSAQDVPARLVALGALAGMREETVAAQAAAGLDAVVHLRRRGGKRFVAQISVLEREHRELRGQKAFQVDGNGKLETFSPAGELLARLDME